MRRKKTETVLLYWLVEGFSDEGSPSSLLDLLRFLSVPPMYFLPVMQVANCLAFTWYLSCRPCCVVPSLNVFIILKAYVATSNLVGLLTFSFFSGGVLGSGGGQKLYPCSLFFG